MDEGERLEIVSQCSLFCKLDSTVQSFVASRATTRRFKQGTPLLRKGASQSSLMLITAGLVKVSLTSWSGREVILKMCTNRDFVGLGSILEGTVSPADHIAETNATVLQVPNSTLRMILDEAPFNAALHQGMFDAYRQAIETIEVIALYSLRARLARLLLSLFLDDAKLMLFYPTYFTQERLAQLTNATRPKVNGHLQVFKEAGAIRIEAGQIKITSPETLGRFSSPTDT
ncbi:Crp/Fnr family transcriptional regulator [uncultured Roseibium sp.]|uniref:Crp/Fnr family transcriptional regulator n=1 Tax=uncultured Roseibium sp. TaxID=1936171 RepID=UPI0025926671|nr:Crp/Fnr family transcriptional regulator [uncultured Roseibium sp.]